MAKSLRASCTSVLAITRMLGILGGSENLTLGTKVKEKALAYCKQNKISLSHLVQSLLNEFLDDGSSTPVT
jgi:hypothetical protein